MAKFDRRIDLYIESAAEFAKPLLKHLRQLVHTACPEILETIKWGFPHFEYQGPLCRMASFKHHCAFGFWKISILPDPNKILETGPDKKGMGALGHLKSLSDLPQDDILIHYIQNAIFLNETGMKVSEKPLTKQKAKLLVPPYFVETLAKNPPAKTTFDQFSYSHKKEYLRMDNRSKNRRNTPKTN